jgi:very-short-patch-repair endonuclease
VSPGNRNCASKEDVERRIAGIVRRQFGVIARKQLLDAGVTASGISRRVHVEKLVPILPTVYAVPWVPETWHQQVVAALLWAGDDAVASHRTAARLWEILEVASNRVEISVPRRLGSPESWVHVHQVAALDPRETRGRKGISVTSPERTLLDLGGAVGEDDLEEALEASIRLGLTTFGRVSDFHSANRGAGRRGAAALGRLLEQRGDQPCTGSPFETKLNALCRKARLPVPTRQHPVYDGDRYITRVDFAYPHASVLIEADSWKHHFGHQPWQRDSNNNNDLGALGWRVLRFTHQDMCKRPEWVVAHIRDALAKPLFRS